MPSGYDIREYEATMLGRYLSASEEGNALWERREIALDRHRPEIAERFAEIIQTALSNDMDLTIPDDELPRLAEALTGFLKRLDYDRQNELAEWLDVLGPWDEPDDYNPWE